MLKMKESVSLFSDVLENTSYYEEVSSVTMPKVVETDPLAPLGFSQTLFSPLVDTTVIPTPEVVSSVHINSESTVDPEPVLHVLASIASPFIIVSDDENALALVQESIPEVPFVLTPGKSVTFDSNLIISPISENREILNPEVLIAPISTSFLPLSSDNSLPPIPDNLQISIPDNQSVPKPNVNPIMEISSTTPGDSSLLINVGHSTSVMGNEEVKGNLIVLVGFQPDQIPLTELVVSEESSVAEVHLDVLDIVGVTADSFVVSFGDYSFNKANKTVIRKKTKKNESLVMWTSKISTLKDKNVEVASVIGAFAALNYE